MNERRVTLADIAARAKVHVTTVSLALRNHRRLPEATRRRIQALAQEMGYAPDPFLRALVAYRGQKMKHRNTPTLAYITNWTTQWGWKQAVAHSDFFAGANAKAQELGYQLEHFWLHEQGVTQKRLGGILYTRGINGVIVASHSRDMGDALELDWENFSAVKIDYFPHHPVMHNVTNNQSSIVRLAIRKVLAGGYRRIGFVMHRGWDHAVDHHWTAGFLCEQQHVPVNDRVPPHIFPDLEPVERWFHETHGSVLADYEPFRAWMEKYKPDVLISKADYILPLVERMGLKVPRDVSFVDLFLEDKAGQTAGVRQNHTLVGATAVEILAGQLQQNKFGLPDVATTTFVQGTWFDGKSCPMPKRETPALVASEPRRAGGDNVRSRTSKTKR